MARVTIELASPHDAEHLAQVSKRAFDSDIFCGAKGPGGPPGYDSFAWQAQMMKRSTAYWKILVDGTIAGGAIIFDKGKGWLYLGRLFIDPAYQRQGVGLEAVRLIEERYPHATRWTLDTPSWNTRTRAFYARAGFRVVKETMRELLMEKQMGGAA